MADPYKPPRPVNIDETAGAPGLPPRTPGDDYTRTSVRVDAAPSIPARSGSGFGTGLMVALVFVVVAVLAFALLGNGDDADVVPAATPDVTIQNSAPPAEPAADPPAPDAVAPDAVAPEAVAPDAGTAEPVAPAPDAAPAAPANP
jgi:hypothetical protein